MPQVVDKSGGQTKGVVYWGSGEPKEADKEALAGASVSLTSFEQFLALGRSQPSEPTPAGPHDTCTIMYTRCGGPTPRLRVQCEPLGVRHGQEIITMACDLMHCKP